MNVCDEEVTDVDGFPSRSKQEHSHEGTYLDKLRGQRVCVSAFHSDTCALAGVFNASDNLGKLHRLENRPKSRQVLVNWVGISIM